jgi:hypothetical protein
MDTGQARKGDVQYVAHAVLVSSFYTIAVSKTLQPNFFSPKLLPFFFIKSKYIALGGAKPPMACPLLNEL